MKKTDALSHHTTRMLGSALHKWSVDPAIRAPLPANLVRTLGCRTPLSANVVRTRVSQDTHS